MTVSDLMAKLAKLPQDAYVEVPGYHVDAGTRPVSSVEITPEVVIDGVQIVFILDKEE